MFASPFASKVSPFAIKVGPASFIFANNLSPDRSCLQVQGSYVRKPLQLAKRFNEVSEGGDDDEDDSVFDLAEDLECEIEEAQDRLEAIYDALSSITGCRPDEDEEWNEE